eukprot:CAMPEP_0113623814 /NCGR_PEP_ID=MMETSP0017_2-20120614/12260_1 /TAXON_ID=2856 /ORGANISM="Cylindrotheca closterium" /LENGTH=624 /DNA_ID=CAMNT_0000533793 /DNA_START=353 /DNA_END=2227 /DNA_ORIENTATION=+ /assembly_acc=CAM_ASM_000147
MPRLGDGTFGQSSMTNASSDDSLDAKIAGSQQQQRIEAAPMSAPKYNPQSSTPSSILRTGGSQYDGPALSPMRQRKGSALELPTSMAAMPPRASSAVSASRVRVRAAESSNPRLGNSASATNISSRQQHWGMELPTTIETTTKKPETIVTRTKVRAAETRSRRDDNMQLPSTRVVSDTDVGTSKKQIWRAAESGTSNLLPEYSSNNNNNNNNTNSNNASRRRRGAPPQRAPPDRSRTRSTPSLRKMVMRGVKGGMSPVLPQTTAETMSAAGPSMPQRQTSGGTSGIRRRTASSAGSDDEDLFSYPSRDSPYKFSRSRKHGNWYSWKNLTQLKVGHMAQVLFVFAVTVLVYESHSKAIFAANQLSQFKEEESLLLLHLQKIEQQSIQLHENLSRLAQSGGPMEPLMEEVDKRAESGDVDFDLIHKQTQQLYQMEEELNHEVRTLQAKIQQSARNHIIQAFGEGPVQVILELDFPEQSSSANQISILLWHDTPHAAWTWLEQIGKHTWDGAKFNWQQSHVIDAIPIHADHSGSRIEFVEQSQHGHEAWTVGLRESDMGDLQMYFNLQDNSNIHKHEVCVGKVIDGFDVLQHLLETTRTQKRSDENGIRVRKASAMHVTRVENLKEE